MSDACLICDLKSYEIALLPWAANLKIQRFIQTSVTVHEQRNPSFSLDISLDCEKHEIIKRRVTKNDIIRTLKFCKRRTQEGETMWTRPPRATEALQAKRIDAAMEKWLATGQTPPQCGELALWIISRILLQPQNGHYNITLFGEVENEALSVKQIRKPSELIVRNTMSGDDDDLPPAFEEAIADRRMYDFKCTDGIGDEGSAGGLIDSVLLNEDRQVRGKELIH
jgi:hypothetical protein